jgi:hypothetical protein
MRFPRIAVLFVYGLLLVLPLASQSPNGTINGQVLDPSGRAIERAEIVIVNDATGVKYFSRTNDDGIYLLSDLPPGPYRLQVSMVGFKTLIKPDITLNVQDALSINFTLPIGALSETVTVEGGASLVNTDSAAVSTVVDQTFVKNMPLNGRSFQDLILLTPGAVTQTPQISQLGNTGLGQTGEFSVNGQRPESNYYAVDGVSANMGAAAGSAMTFGAGPSGPVASSTALGTTQALVSVDDLQEFRVQSSTYSAEYGRNPGAQFAFETKAGTNQIHGTAYDYLRNGFFDAQDWFNGYFGTPQPALHQNDFGGTLGGPLEIPGLYHGRNKTFFFVSYEGLRLTAPQAATANFVPDTLLRESTPPPLSQALNAFPLPTANGLDDVANGIAEYIGSWSNPSSLNSTSVRMDHVVSSKLGLFFRFSDTPSRSVSRGTPASFTTPTMDTTLAYTLRTYTGGATSAFSNRLSNDIRVNYSSNDVTGRTAIDALGGSTPVDLLQLSGLGPGAEPELFFFLGGNLIFMNQRQQSGAQRQWNLVDTARFALGRHQFKFGADYRRLAPLAIPANPIAVYQYLSKSQVQSNTDVPITVLSNGPGYPLYTNFSAFAQDEWRISQRLTLSLGIRWEVNPAPGVTKGLKPYALQGVGPSTWALAPQGTPLWQTSWYNFAPRLGGRLHSSQYPRS